MTGSPVIGEPTTGGGVPAVRLVGLHIVDADLVEVLPLHGHGPLTALAGVTLAIEELDLLGTARIARITGADAGPHRVVSRPRRRA